eukprot:COSAG02_NODE_32521_length_515_cov_0.641827_1_plen_42_part_01
MVRDIKGESQVCMLGERDRQRQRERHRERHRTWGCDWSSGMT